MELAFPDRTAIIRRETARLCRVLGWAPLHEVPLPNGRRADILALRPNGSLACIEIKSGLRDFLTDRKWPEYREFTDALYFAVDTEFPHELVPEDTGLMIVDDRGADLIRDARAHPLATARRRSLIQRFAMLAACRLAALEDPAGFTLIPNSRMPRIAIRVKAAGR